MSELIDTLADFAVNFGADELPAAVSEHTKVIVADTFGAIVGGSVEPEVRALAETLCDGQGGGATVLGMGKTADPATAALINGTGGTFLEMDEGNGFAMGHPAIHTIPATFAAAERYNTGARAFVTAVALGYEIGGRVGGASRLRPQMHPHGTWGAICAAVGIGRLAGFDTGKMKTAINIAANMCLGTSRPTMLQGATVRNAYAGISGQLGHLSCTLTEAGFSGERDGIANVFSNVVSDAFDPELATKGLGRHWIVAHNYFKLHACCRYNHGALDALGEISQRHNEVRANSCADISRIDVTSYNLAAELDDQAPGNILAAKFSVPFAVATTLINGASGLESFTLGAVRDQSIQDLAKRVHVREDPAMTAARTDLECRPAAVAVTMRDGAVFRASNEINRGSPAKPYSAAELRQKYDTLTARRWSGPDSGAIYDAIMNLGQSKDMDQLRSLLRQADQAGPENRGAG